MLIKENRMRCLLAVISLFALINHGQTEDIIITRNAILGRVKVDDQYPLVFAKERVLLLKNVKLTTRNADFSFQFPNDVIAHTVAVGMMGHDSAGHVLLTYRDGVVRKNRTVYLKITKYDKSIVVDYTDDLSKASLFHAHHIAEKSKNVKYEYALDAYRYEYVDDNALENRFLSYYETPSKMEDIQSDIAAHPLRLNTKDKASLFSLYQEVNTGK